MTDKMRTVTCTAPVNIAVIKYCKIYTRLHEKWEGLGANLVAIMVQGASEMRLWSYPSTRH